MLTSLARGVVGIVSRFGEDAWARLCRRYGLKYLVLFGSRASGKADRLSDWDFAARFGRRPGIREIVDLLADIMDLVRDDRVDLVILDRPGLPPALLHEALWRGKPLCILDRDAYLWDKVRALALYQEYLVVFRPGLEAMVKRLAKRGAPAKN